MNDVWEGNNAARAFIRKKPGDARDATQGYYVLNSESS